MTGIDPTDPRGALPHQRRRRQWITEPGVYTDLSEEDYHSDPVVGGSLSRSGAQLLLPPKGCPAKFRYARDHPDDVDATKAVFRIGHAAHRLVLGRGQDIVELDAMDWRKPDVRVERDQVLADGRIPLLPDEHEQVMDMASAVLDHPHAAKIFAPGAGTPELSLFWQERVVWTNPGDKTEHTTKIMRRGRPDWVSRLRLPDGRLIVADYKTAESAEPRTFMRSAADHGYHMQAGGNLDAVHTLLGEEAAYLLVVQEKVKPYVVTVVELDSVALMWGRELNSAALRVYARCMTTGRWPGYADDIVPGRLPFYAEKTAEETTGT